jgi:hypothetical protein
MKPHTYHFEDLAETLFKIIVAVFRKPLLILKSNTISKYFEFSHHHLRLKEQFT